MHMLHDANRTYTDSMLIGNVRCLVSCDRHCDASNQIKVLAPVVTVGYVVYNSRIAFMLKAFSFALDTQIRTAFLFSTSFYTENHDLVRPLDRMRPLG